jgi:hypothetical protein
LVVAAVVLTDEAMTLFLKLSARCLPALRDMPYIHSKPCLRHRAQLGLVWEHRTLASLHESQDARYFSALPVPFRGRGVASAIFEVASVPQ